MTDYGTNVLEQTHILEGTWSFNGQTFALEVEDISGQDFALIQKYTELAVSVESVGQNPDEVSEAEIESLNEKAENLDNFSWEDDDSNTSFIPSVVDAKLHKPDVDPANVGQSKLSALFRGMMETWQESESVATAKNEMPLDEGNG